MAKNQVQGSYGRCVQNPRFLQRFYSIFFNSNPAIRPLFAKTDMDKQLSLLRQGIAVALMFSDGADIGKMALGRIRESHDRNHMNIRPELYRYWVESLLKAVSEFDPQFTPELEEKWKVALAPAIDFIKSGY